MRHRTTFLALAVSFGLIGCNIVPSRDPTGERMPPAEGKTLAGARITLDEALAGEPALLTIPYTNDAQFDADRWALGLNQLETPLRRFELGVVPSTFGLLVAPAIDMDRRKKRADVEWPAVLCFYSDSADAIATQTGMGDAQFARVLLVDGQRTIVWYCDKGYTPERCAELDRQARTLAR